MRLTRTLKVDDAHEDAVWCVAWAPGGRSLVTGSVDESVKVWDVAAAAATPGAASPEPTHTYTGHTLGAVSVAVDATGEHAASSSLDSFVRVWSLKDSATKAVIETPPGETWQIAFPPAAASPAGATLLAAAGGAANKVVIWSADDASAVAEMLLPDAGDAGARGRDRFVLSVAYSPDGAVLACGAADGGVALFDVATGGLLHSLAGHHKPVRSLAFTPDSKTLITACDDMHARLYDVAAGALIDAMGGHTSWVTSVAPHPAYPFAATASSDGTVRLWDLTARACVQTAKEHGDQVWGVAFSSDGGALASVGDDKAVCVYAAG